MDFQWLRHEDLEAKLKVFNKNGLDLSPYHESRTGYVQCITRWVISYGYLLL
jgi:hypothetical protein